MQGETDLQVQAGLQGETDLQVQLNRLSCGPLQLLLHGPAAPLPPLLVQHGPGEGGREHPLLLVQQEPGGEVSVRKGGLSSPLWLAPDLLDNNYRYYCRGEKDLVCP